MNDTHNREIIRLAEENNEAAEAERRLSRKEALQWIIGGAGMVGVSLMAGCGGGSSSTPSGATPTPTPTSTTSATATPTATATATATATPTPTPTATPVASCTLIPSDEEGPFPLLSFLSASGIVRKDITEGKAGVPLTLKLTLVNVNGSCGPLTNAAVYIWHCDKDGGYSGYSGNGNGNHLGETYLRGIQISDTNGDVTFTTIYPGWYAGRITHIHFKIYLNDNLNVTASVTSQLAFPQDITQTVYNSSLYASHGQNSSVASNAADHVFSDGVTYQLLSLTGDVTSGYAASLVVGVSA